MNTLSQLSCFFLRKGFVRFIAPLLLSMLMVVGLLGHTMLTLGTVLI